MNHEELALPKQYLEAIFCTISYGLHLVDSKKNNIESPSKKLHILLAEDNLIQQKVINILLTSLGHRVTIACNGKVIVEMFKPGKFDLILMDIRMPVMDGVAATQKLRAKYNDLPPIVGLSAIAFEGDREKYMELGMDDYLRKPVSKSDFKRCFESVCCVFF
jgi:two-component system, sensor histidine kinase and response regulator